MYKPLLLCALAALVLSGAGSSYEITKVIEVGPADDVPFVWPLKWSPDGARLAYFHERSLFLADTVGASRKVVLFDMIPYRYEWLSNEEIVVHLKTRLPDRTELNQAVYVPLDSGNMTVYREYIHRAGEHLTVEAGSFSGPFLSLEGNVYYRTNVVQATTRPYSKDREGVEMELRVRYKQSASSNLSDNHFVDWGANGLYKVSCDLRDSVRLARAAADIHITEPKVNRDLTYYVDGGVICRFSDSAFTVLDTFVKEFPENTGDVGFLFCSFNPNLPEVLFSAILGNGTDYETYRAGTYDLVSNTFTLIDNLIGKEGCFAPSYAPDGVKIAFLLDGKVHILYRRDSL